MKGPKNFFGRQRGLSLIELVISLGIMVLLTTGGLVSLSRLKEGQALKSEADRLAMTIRRARQLAEAPLSAANFKDYQSYGVRLDSVNQKYILEARKNSDGSGSQQKISETKLANGVEFGGNNLGTQPAVYFSVESNAQIGNLNGVVSPRITLKRKHRQIFIRISKPYGVVEVFQ